MRPREALSGPLYAMAAARRVLTDAPGAFRVLLLHDEAEEAELARLLDHVASRYGFLTPDEAHDRLGGRVIGRGSVLLTFDDGFADNRGLAERLLAPRGIHAVFFVCPGLIDLEAGAQRLAVSANICAGAQAPPLMGWGDLAALRRAGHTIGAHSLTHRRLAGLSGQPLVDEVAGAGARIAERLGEKPQWFAYPFGDVGSIDAAALDVIARHYPICRSGVRGLNRVGQSSFAVFADHVDVSAGYGWQKMVVAGGLDPLNRAARRHLIAMAPPPRQAA